MPQNALIDLAGEIADGSPIAWEQLESSPDLAPDLLARARIVERVAQAHAGLPSVESFSASPFAGPALADDADTPKAWGPLTIIERIGCGTFGDVYRARDPRLDRPVALKLHRRRDRGESAVIDEGHLLARVRHPNVVTIYGAERIDGRVGLWMELIDGPTLEQELRERGPVSANEVVAIGMDLSRALGAVHRAGLLHRDLKTQNVMRDRDGRLVLTDFGAGRDVSESWPSGSELAGTPLYLAPEVLNGQAASVASDVYGLGVLLYHLATGAFPIAGRSLAALRDAHAQGARVPVGVACPDLPSSLVVVIERATAADPAARYESAADLESALVRVARQSGTRRAAWIAAGLAVLTLTGGAVAWTLRPESPLARLAFLPPDQVLITHFENNSGDPLLDGSLEVALEREFAKPDTVGLVARDRVEAALQLMKRPADTVVTRAIGRDVSLRDGDVKALVAGRIDKYGPLYVLTAELVDPANDSTVATFSDEAPTREAILGGLTRIAEQLRATLGERRDRIRGSDPVTAPATTSSLLAFKLFNESTALAKGLHWDAARDLAQQAVEADPDFGSAWIHLAFVTRRAQGLKAPVPPDQDPIRPLLERAFALAAKAPAWERHWIRGSYYQLRGEYELAVPEYWELLRLRPDHPGAAINLQASLENLNRRDLVPDVYVTVANLRPQDIAANHMAASELISKRRDFAAARPFVNRLKALLTGDHLAVSSQDLAQAWLIGLPAYEAWDRGDIDTASAVIDHALAELRADSRRPRDQATAMLFGFLLGLGRLHDAGTVVMSIADPGGRAGNLTALAEAADDRDQLRAALARVGVNNIRLMPRMVRAGRLEEARRMLERPVESREQVWHEVGAGELALADGRADEAIGHFQTGLVTLKEFIRTNSSYYEECESFATALKRVEQPARAISTLETCAAERPGYGGNFPVFTWLHLEMRLADEYRQAGRIQEAQKIENTLRRLLSHADPDHPLVARLRAREPR